MLNKIRNMIANDNEIGSEWLRVLSLFFLLLSGSMSFLTYTHTGIFWDSQFSFEPGFISTILAVFLISPLYLRGLLKWNKSIYTLLSFVLILLVFGSFIELAMGGNKNPIIVVLLSISIVLSWLGMRAIAGVGWILTLAAGIYSAIINDMAMGFYGFIYIGSGFLGLILHSGLNPGKLVLGLKEEFSSNKMVVANNIKAIHHGGKS